MLSEDKGGRISLIKHCGLFAYLPAIPWHHAVAIRMVAHIHSEAYWCQGAHMYLILQILQLCILTCPEVP